jgi:hypothetical protein
VVMDQLLEGIRRPHSDQGIRDCEPLDEGWEQAGGAEHPANDLGAPTDGAAVRTSQKGQNAGWGHGEAGLVVGLTTSHKLQGRGLLGKPLDGQPCFRRRVGHGVPVQGVSAVGATRLAEVPEGRPALRWGTSPHTAGPPCQWRLRSEVQGPP